MRERISGTFARRPTDQRQRLRYVLQPENEPAENCAQPYIESAVWI